MNELNGSVALLALPDLLQYLSTNGKSGLLTVNQARMSKSLYLSPKGMRLVSTTPRCSCRPTVGASQRCKFR